ncbi:conserved Plasmodium protein, unknown function [Plasmodium ovale]|uniref:Uncharacterized protein n=1 Tax=Plasmodium ovale TaxID=36330 RepID=A0A1C3KT61_PLAOA|nr:conserved Plasmodium protein, unknown function [Plasmodium ovale]
MYVHNDTIFLFLVNKDSIVLWSEKKMTHGVDQPHPISLICPKRGIYKCINFCMYIYNIYVCVHSMYIRLAIMNFFLFRHPPFNIYPPPSSFRSCNTEECINNWWVFLTKQILCLNQGEMRDETDDNTVEDRQYNIINNDNFDGVSVDIQEGLEDIPNG